MGESWRSNAWTSSEQLTQQQALGSRSILALLFTFVIVCPRSGFEFLISNMSIRKGCRRSKVISTISPVVPLRPNDQVGIENHSGASAHVLHRIYVEQHAMHMIRVYAGTPG